MSQTPERTVKKDGYEVTFHPAFASRCDVVRKDGKGVDLYRQQGAHHHETGERHPLRHQIRLKGGPDQRDFTLRVDDPKAQIAKITIELYDPSHEPGWGNGDDSVETFSVTNDAYECPPFCDDPTKDDNDGDAR
jgi:hypothetical protein